MNKKHIKGFTLIEMMVAIAVISLLTLYALPNYRAHVLKTKRTEARNVLMEVAAMQEKFFATNNRYANAVDLNLATFFPAPSAANGLAYTITVASTNVNYTITAVAFYTQAQDTDCATFTLDNLGRRTPTAGDCWR